MDPAGFKDTRLLGMGFIGVRYFLTPFFSQRTDPFSCILRRRFEKVRKMNCFVKEVPRTNTMRMTGILPCQRREY